MSLRDRLNQPLFAAGRTKTPLGYRLLHIAVAAVAVGTAALWLSVPRPACDAPVSLESFSPVDAYLITLAEAGDPLEMTKAVKEATGVDPITLMPSLRQVSAAATQRQIVAARCHADVRSIEPLTVQ